MALRISKFLSGAASLVGLLAAMSSLSCVSVDYPDIAFRCNPAKDGNAACPDGYICCSDDPIAYNGDNGVAVGVLPAYAGSSTSTDPAAGSPIFSGDNNPLSASGMCIRDGLIPPEAGLIEAGAQGCPIPCNPAWQTASVEAVCGRSTVAAQPCGADTDCTVAAGGSCVAGVCTYTSLCCQTVEITESDCVQDADSGCFRPVSGQDIPGSTNWSPGLHETAQDPGGSNCVTFAQGNETALNACYRALSVADQRGFCLQVNENVTRCPLTDASYIDACEQLNINAGRTDCPAT